MSKIAVRFEYEGKRYQGTLDEISGAGHDQWQLMVAGYYWGRLRKVGDRWYFDAGKYQLGDDLVNYFAELLIAWYE